MTAPHLSEKTDRTVYIETLGCQMNQNDSELMLGLLAADGFAAVTDPATADLVIINTCQIRGSAEDKAFSHLGVWGKLKRKRPDLKIGMAGCVAQQTGDGIFQRAPYVDFVVGTQNLHDLPQLVCDAFKAVEPPRLLATDRQKDRSTYDYVTDITPIRQSKTSAWVTIIEGCDYFCTYCVVPYTRGRQISRPAASILDEVRILADQGYREITLLGQTVDAYGKDFTERQYGLAHLLHDIHEQVPDMARIRFMTSHPLDLDDAVIDAVADLPRVMEFIHIPMQAGDDEVLARMRRGYTAAEYFALTDKLRARISNVAISGDFIVGFPGETEAQFQKTLDAVSRVGFDLANTAAYSPRKQTPAGLWTQRGEGVISEAEKEDRLQRLNAVITEVGTLQNLPLVGTTQEVLVEGKSKRTHYDRWRGRTRTNKLINFDVPPDTAIDLTGQLLPVYITEATAFALKGYWQTEAAPMPIAMDQAAFA